MMVKLRAEKGAYKRRIEDLELWSSPSSRMTTVELTHEGKVYRVMFFSGSLISIATRNGVHVSRDTELGGHLFEAAKARVTA